MVNIPLDSNFIKAGDTRVVIFTTSQTSISQIELLRAHGVEVFFDDAPHVDLNKMMLTLKKIGVDHLMVEGGGTVNFELIRLGVVDEIILYVAPMLFGGATAPTLADGLGLTRSDAVPLKLMNVETHEDGGIILRYKLQVTLEV
jgi:riboflavin-specific deaminase-like protein